MQSSEKKNMAYSKGELKNLYNISWHQLRLWLEPFKEAIGEYKGGKYTPAQIKIIFDKLGEPGEP